MTDEHLDLAAQITRRLAEPFDPSEVRFKPAVVSGNRGLALAYVDARVVQDRLDEVLGVDGWQDDFEHLPDGQVLCRLKCRIGNEWIQKTDVGGQSEQPDGGDRVKAAVSDALKRAAVKFGVGRYLYRLPQQWVDYNAKAKRFATTPALPKWALPADEPRPAPTPAQLPPPKAAPAKPTAAEPTTAAPANGTELLKRLQDYEAKLVAQGLCQRDDLVEHVANAGVATGLKADIRQWASPQAFQMASEAVKRFEAFRRAPRGTDAYVETLLAELRRRGKTQESALGWLSEQSGIILPLNEATFFDLPLDLLQLLEKTLAPSPKGGTRASA